jgi:hypothetical protein
VWERRRVAEAAAAVVLVFVVDEVEVRKAGGEVEAGLGSLLSPPSDSSKG